MRQYNKKWKQENRLAYRAMLANRRTRLRNATPIWANKKSLRQIYLNCPPGYEVDHIIPLKGKNICGLHIPENLQYLTVEENRKKSNNFP